MTRNPLSKARRFALALVLGNLALVVVLASVLPPAALGLLPVVALTVPLLSAAALEETLKHNAKSPARAAHSSRLMGALHQAA